MDLKQTRLTREEWNNIEIQVPEQEKHILHLIVDGFDNTDLFYNNNKSLISLMKIEPTQEIHEYLYKTYFEEQVVSFSKKTNHTYTPLTIKKQINKKYQIRIDNTNNNIEQMKAIAFEFMLLELIQQTITAPKKSSQSLKGYYTLVQLLAPTISHINTPLLQFIKTVVIPYCSNYITVQDLFYDAANIIETNNNILKYQDIRLFEHQSALYNFVKGLNAPALIFYTSPTGNGKTLTPLGLVAQYRVIFICASRHIGLALAKSAISMEKRIAIAFGCETADDIRLHYFAAEVYTKNTKSGGIYKVDNSYGNNVEIIICDVMSYLVAMHYMLSFNEEPNIITFWDEPTISMDVDDHPLHPIISKNWAENKISKVVLSCATMPKELELQPTINDFLLKFPGAIIKTVSSFDFKKTIRIIDSNGIPVLPHTLFTNYRDVIACVEHCQENPTLLRYMDLASIVEFMRIMEHNNVAVLDEFTVETLTMTTIKRFYLKWLLDINPDNWCPIQHQSLWHVGNKMDNKGKNEKESKELRKINSTSGYTNNNDGLSIYRTQSLPINPTISTTVKGNGCVLLSTSDAYTLTDGPTLYLVEDTIKIGRFLYQQSKIPESIIQHVVSCIDNNNKLEKVMGELQKKIDDKINATIIGSEKKEGTTTRETREMMETVEQMRRQIQAIQLPSQYIPNTATHRAIWSPIKEITANNNMKSFPSNVEDSFIKRVMELGNEINNEVKILLMMGIGIFCDDLPIPYLEIIKELSYNQKLYLVIASSDYIYGTNYQFCHGFLGRDLVNMTPQKIIQAMGRVGRGNIQQNYTVRFRNDELLKKLFLPIGDNEFNKEANVMNRLFT